MPYQLVLERRFVKNYKKLSKIERKLVDTKLRILADNPWHPSLRTKKIRSTDEFECSVNMDIRIAFFFEGNTIVILLDIGHHDILLGRRTR
ncbi:type II toxin-antitoxin system RelE/ParE family toxin [Trueperella pyogenes]|uniref:type II toxin-antitoxin system RelE/ParE family toxin n=1 Tax=Trueperella pyogenes TaxID=1661 RepID=UPI00345D4EBE